MPAERYYTPEDLNPHSEITLMDSEFHHLCHVMRGRVGDNIELINGRGSFANGKILRLEKKQAIIALDSIENVPASQVKIVLAQALPRFNRLDTIVEKCTELGMTDLWLFPGEHSERKDMTEHQLERFEGVVISATKQCGRLFLPTVTVKPPIKKWSGIDLPLYYGDVSGKAPHLLEVLKPSDKGVIFCTGPESGLSDAEEKSLVQLGARGVKLHANILRTDTASIAALSLITHFI